jgi:hypothetical protein
MSPPWRRILLLKTPSSLVAKAMQASCHDRGRASFHPPRTPRSIMEGAHMYMRRSISSQGAAIVTKASPADLAAEDSSLRPYLVTFFWYLPFPTERALEKRPAGHDAMCSLP